MEIRSEFKFVATRPHAFVAATCFFPVLLALFLAVPVSAQEVQEAQSANSSRQSIEKMDPMDVDGLDSNLAFILEKYYDSTFGGAENWETVESVRFDGLLHLPNGVARFVAFKKKPDYCKVAIFTGGGSRIVMAYDGKDAWQIKTAAAGAEPTDMPEKEARNFIRDATIGGHLLCPLLEGKRIELIGVERIGDVACYKIEITLADGERITSYLDTSNYTERRQTTRNALNGLEEHTTFSDFRKVDGVRFPFASKMESAGERIHRVEMLKIQIDQGVMPWMFQRPSGGYIPREAPKEVDVDLFDQEPEPTPSGSGFGLQEPEGTAFPALEEDGTAFPALEKDEIRSILDDIGKPQR